MLRTPSAIEGQGGAISEDKARERNRMLQVRDQMAQLAAENGLKVSDAIANQLLPTPALGHIRNYDEPVEDYLARRKKMEDGEYKGMPGVSLGVALRMEMLPTPRASEPGSTSPGYGDSLNDFASRVTKGYAPKDLVDDLLPTPIVRDYKDGSAAQTRDGKVSTDTVARAVFNSGEVSKISWGKFEPAIRRWEAVLGRPAPAPTKPDGKDGAHRLSSALTEWMMGLPEGWITDVGLSRVDELKACGNGVVPQQAELALRILLEGVDLSDKVDQVNLPTPTVSDVYTADLASSQMSDDSMHSVSLPRAINRLIK